MLKKLSESDYYELEVELWDLQRIPLKFMTKTDNKIIKKSIKKIKSILSTRVSCEIYKEGIGDGIETKIRKSK